MDHKKILEGILVRLGVSTSTLSHEAESLLGNRNFTRGPITRLILIPSEKERFRLADGLKIIIERLTSFMSVLGYKQPLHQALSGYDHLIWSGNQTMTFGISLVAAGVLQTEDEQRTWLTTMFGEHFTDHLPHDVPQDAYIVGDRLAQLVWLLDLDTNLFPSRWHVVSEMTGHGNIKAKVQGKPVILGKWMYDVLMSNPIALDITNQVLQYFWEERIASQRDLLASLERKKLTFEAFFAMVLNQEMGYALHSDHFHPSIFESLEEHQDEGTDLRS